MALLKLKDPMELFVKRREFLPGSGFLSCCDMTLAVESDVKPNSFLVTSEYDFVAASLSSGVLPHMPGIVLWIGLIR